MSTSRSPFVSWLALFSSMSTLLCCALPALLVLLGFGSTVAAIISTVPQVTLLSTNKPMVFGVAALLVGTALWLQFSNASSCPVDPQQVRACQRLKKRSVIVTLIATLFLLVGVFVAFVLPVLI